MIKLDETPVIACVAAYRAFGAYPPATLLRHFLVHQGIDRRHLTNAIRRGWLNSTPSGVEPTDRGLFQIGVSP